MDARAAALAVASAAEAAGDGNVWADVAILAAEALDADSASVVFWGLDGGAVVRACPRTDPDLHGRYGPELHARNYLWSRASALPAGKAVTEALLGGRDVYLRSAIFNEFIRPQGMEALMMLNLTGADGPAIGIVTLGRRRGRDAFQRSAIEDGEVLCRAISRTLQAASLPSRLQGCADIDISLLVTPDGMLLVDPPGLDRLVRLGFVSVRAGMVEIAGLPGLGAAIRSAAGDPAGWPPPRPRILGPVAAGAGCLGVSLLPGGPSAPGAVRLRIVAQTRPDPAQSLSRRFGLTRREAEIAILIGAGLTLPEAAQRLGIGLTTAKTHLGRLFDKTETRSQLALGLLVARHAGRGARDGA